MRPRRALPPVECRLGWWQFATSGRPPGVLKRREFARLQCGCSSAVAALDLLEREAARPPANAQEWLAVESGEVYFPCHCRVSFGDVQKARQNARTYRFWPGFFY
jgi:hypothetical protein